MRIARVFPTFQTDLQYAEHYLAKEFRKAGHSTYFITSDKYLKYWSPYLKRRDGEGTFVFEDYVVYRLSSCFPNEKAIFKNWIRLFKLLYRSKFDVIHLLGAGTFTTYIVLFLSCFHWSSRPKFVISDHSDTRTHSREGVAANAYYLLFRVLFKIFGHKVDHVITFSEASATLLMKRFHIDRDKLKVISLGYDQDIFSFVGKNKNVESKLVVGFAGKVSQSKRIDMLINFLAENSLFDEIKLIVVGVSDSDEYAQTLFRAVEELNADVEFRPFANSQELAEFYNYIDVAVYPGGISITTIEASGCGTPVVIYKSIEGLEERVDQNRGYLFEDMKELRAILKKLVEDKRKGKIDNELISFNTAERYSWRKIMNKYLNVYND